MSRIHRRLRALAFLLVLLPLSQLQRAHANPTTAVGDGTDEGCTRTLGYWKNHSAHADNPSQNIPWPISEETLLCGKTWFDILNTTPRGEAWVILAHQWIAAKLNAASGASTSVLGNALDEAGDLLADNCGGISGDARDRALELASLLDDFNNGVIGPGHCGGITDCNKNGVDDATDIQNGTSADVNKNGIPDECEGGITEYCNGWGLQNGGVDCPCGNTLPPGSPTGCINSSGHGASLTGAGSPLVSHDTVVLTATGIPSGRVAYFLEGAVSTAGNPFGNGTRCIGGPFVRLGKVSHSTGHDTFPAPNTPPISQQLGITPGQQTFFQAVYRDAGGPCGAGSNATNAVAILWGP